jgi:hypothetical protein
MEGTPPPGGQYPPGGQVPPPPPPQAYPPQHPGYGQQGYGGHEQGGPGLTERAGDVASAVQRRVRTPETKPFYLTSEFLVWAFCVIAVIIAGAVIGNGDHGDVLRANTVWLFITIISFAYIISRGISKAGTKYRDYDRRY